MTLLTEKFKIAERMTEDDYWNDGRYGEFQKYEHLRFTEEEVLGIINTFLNKDVKEVIVDRERLSITIKAGYTERHLGSGTYREMDINSLLN